MVLSKYKKFSLLFISFWLVLLLAVLHSLAGAFYFYWDISWFDTMMHFLGGFSLGMLVIWLVYARRKARPSLSQSLFAGLMAVLAIGIGWEIFEYANGLTQSTEAYPSDIRNDLIADLVGAGLASLLARWQKFYN